MILLALESSCDETSAAVIADSRVLANSVSTQIALHAEYGGVVPELATREHLRNLIPVTRSALSAAGITTSQIDAIAATRGPGLPAALLVGLKAGQAMAYVLRKPFLSVHHHEAHLYSPWISGDPPCGDFSQFQPSVSLIASGGHTILVHVKNELEHAVLGSTVDDAAGECFDKTGKLIGLAYPAGPLIDRLSARGNPKAYDFPRPMLHEPNDDFSFAGLKTSVRYYIQKNPSVLESDQSLCDLCASVQAAIVEVLVKKTIRAALRTGVRCVTASGGVICNSTLRRELASACARTGLKLQLADRKFSTDNAAMVGIIAERKLLAGAQPTPLDEDIDPGWSLGTIK